MIITQMRHPFRPRTAWGAAVAVLLAAAAVAAAGCGSSRDQATTTSFAGIKVPPRPAPPLRLSDYRGKRVNLADLRGRAVLVTFLYTHCPDVCPLIVGNLQAAQKELGPGAEKLQILAVSVDPEGDTPRNVTKFLDAHDMTGKMDWLIGSRAQLERTWKAWGIAARVPKSDPELVEHSAQIFGIDAAGRIRALYPANFNPAQVVHDVPLLASG